jgi:hypothetical protein
MSGLAFIGGVRDSRLVVAERFRLILVAWATFTPMLAILVTLRRRVSINGGPYACHWRFWQ